MSAITLDYITDNSLNQILNDKTTGQNLAGGQLWFYEDNNRTVAKAVFEQINLGGTTPTNPPNYTYQPLANPLTLSGTGTIVDANGNQVALYYYPWDANGNVQLYYIACFNYLGEPQFTREGFPYSFETDNPGVGGDIGNDNQISNPQFVEVNFNPATGLTIPTSGSGTMTVQIAPDWDLVIGYSGTGQVIVNRVSNSGNQKLPTNPPYTLTIMPSGAITTIDLIQTLQNNGAIWSPQVANQGGYIAANFTLGVGTSAIMYYLPNNLTKLSNNVILLSANNQNSVVTSYAATTAVNPSTNSVNSDTAYVNIDIQLSSSMPSSITSVQVVGLNSHINGLSFKQDTPSRQIDHLYNYYNEPLQFKPLESYLVGWDFPLNPSQFFNAASWPMATGANSNYMWDQTIVYQSVTSGVTPSRAADQSLVLTAAATGQFALVQYIESASVYEILEQIVSSNLRAMTNQVGGVPCTISLWYTTGTLPSVAAATYKSLVATLNPNGSVATTNAGSQAWVQVAFKNIGSNSFTILKDTVYSDYGVAGWQDITGAGSGGTATFAAIVIGFGALTMGNTITIQSASLVPGLIPTRPAPKKLTDILYECQRYFWMTFQLGTPPAQGVGGGTGAYIFPATVTSANLSVSPSIFLPYMRAAPNIDFYNPIHANSQAYDNDVTTDCTNTNFHFNTGNNFGVKCNIPGGGSVGDTIEVHITADARLGIV